jgi:hypothetical protein
MFADVNQRLVPSMPVAGYSRRVHCEGGSTTVINGNRYHVFTSSGTLTVVRGGTVFALIVAAGGSPRTRTGITSGGFGAGGGGGGGLANYLPVVVPEGTYQAVTIGSAVSKSRGGNSSLTCLRPATLTGGGTSGNDQADSQQDGGSGGGRIFQSGIYGGAIGLGNTPSFVPSQGSDGGASTDDGNDFGISGGGGGFSGPANSGPGGIRPPARDGGQGLALDADTLLLGSLINNNTHFSSGGGGHGNTQSGNSHGRGGTGAGDGAYASDATSATMYGCGGGGGTNSSGTTTLGFQGIVIIRYPIG